ncbi:MAG: rod shape determining protein RodA [Planctomycetota bacterium]|jgi:rod shape determining protein RodA
MKGLKHRPLPERAGQGLSNAFDGFIHWQRVEWPILLVAAMLLGTGMVFIQAMAQSDELFLRHDISWEGHLKKVAVSLPVLVIAFFIKPRFLRRNAWLIYVLCLVLLILVPFIGSVHNNARRWIQLPFGFDIQPSELAKLGLIILLGSMLYRRRLRDFDEWFAPTLLVLIPTAMVAAQPDLGTALTIIPITLGMYFLAGASSRILITLCLVMAVSGYSIWKLELVQDYQLKRIDTWVETYEPEGLIAAKKRGAFHAYQGRVAIGNGDAYGRGLGMGIANQAGHLPERESDSIFSVIAEESGWIGATALLAIYALFVCLILASAGAIRERFARLVVGGIGLYFAAHFFIHVAVNLGLMPMTGLTLPLISTGGSSMLASFAAVGLVLGLGARHEPSLDEDAFRF